MPTPIRELFEYIATIVPYWRVSDEAWPLKGEYLTGKGVLRNDGGQVMVMVWNDDTRRQLARLREMLGDLSSRIVVIVDDEGVEDLDGIAATVRPIAVLPWSRKANLASFIIKDNAG